MVVKMTSLFYSRDELPVECPECDNAQMTVEPIHRDSYTELSKHHCPICRETYRVTITED